MCQIIVRTHKAQEIIHFRQPTSLDSISCKRNKSCSPLVLRFARTSRLSRTLRAFSRALCARFLFLPNWAWLVASLDYGLPQINAHCDSANSVRDENEHLRQIFHKNDYSDEFIDTNKYKQNKQNDECASTEMKNELTTVSLPYIRGTSETIARILKPFNIRISHKPTRTLRHLLSNVKDKDDPKDRQGTVYRIRCNDCNGTYIGETGRKLTKRLEEHQTATDKEDLTNNIAQHHRKTGHDINWDSATCLTHSTDKDQTYTWKLVYQLTTRPT